MAKGRREIPPCCKTYGLPLYCAAWVPLDKIPSSAAASSADSAASEIDEGKKDEEEKTLDSSTFAAATEAEADSALDLPVKGNHLLLALGGGGGEGRSGIPNAVLISLFDFVSRSLSDHPVHRVGTEDEVPYRMAMHPGGDGFVCSFPNCCRWFEWDMPESREPSKLSLKSIVKTLQKLKDVGLQLALAFNSDGTSFAAGGVDGHLRVFKWPDMEVIFDQTDAHATVKYLDFSSDGKFLVSLGGKAPCRVWDLTLSTAVASLLAEDGETFGYCRFSPSNDILYITAMHGDQGKVISWSTSSWKRIRSKKIARDPISAFNVSYDGKLFAIGTIEGDVTIISSSDFKALMSVKKAHLGLVTALEFSHNSRALVSASLDSTARVTVIESRKDNRSNLWLALLVIFVAMLIYFIKIHETF